MEEDTVGELAALIMSGLTNGFAGTRGLFWLVGNGDSWWLCWVVGKGVVGCVEASSCRDIWSGRRVQLAKEEFEKLEQIDGWSDRQDFSQVFGIEFC